MVVCRDGQNRPDPAGLCEDRLGIVGPSAVAVEDRRVKEIGMEETKLEKLARLSGKVTSKALDALGRRGFDLCSYQPSPSTRSPRRSQRRTSER